MSNTGHKGITRVDLPAKGLHGWWVRVQWGGRRKSAWLPTRLGYTLRQAISYRDNLELSMGKPRTEKPIKGKARGHRL